MHSTFVASPVRRLFSLPHQNCHIPYLKKIKKNKKKIKKKIKNKKK
jgi:hypothetical protein